MIFNIRCLRFLFLLAAFCTSLASCGPAASELRIERQGSTVATVQAETARTPVERNQGLMNRKSLADGRGMLFVFEKDEILSFWMKNTLIPLSIAFIAADGRITEIRDMQPHDLNPVKSSRSVRYALEVPRGWFTRAGVQVGDMVQIQLTVNK